MPPASGELPPRSPDQATGARILATRRTARAHDQSPVGITSVPRIVAVRSVLLIKKVASSGPDILPAHKRKKAVPFGTAWGIKLVLLAAADEQRSGTEGAEGDGRRLRSEGEALETSRETGDHAGGGRRRVAGATENARGEHGGLAADQSGSIVSARLGVPSANDELSRGTTSHTGNRLGTSGETAVGSDGDGVTELGAEGVSFVAGVGEHLDLIVRTSSASTIRLEDVGNRSSEVVLDKDGSLTIGGRERSQSERCRDDFIHELCVSLVESLKELLDLEVLIPSLGRSIRVEEEERFAHSDGGLSSPSTEEIERVILARGVVVLEGIATIKGFTSRELQVGRDLTSTRRLGADDAQSRSNRAVAVSLLEHFTDEGDLAGSIRSVARNLQERAAARSQGDRGVAVPSTEVTDGGIAAANEEMDGGTIRNRGQNVDQLVAVLVIQLIGNHRETLGGRHRDISNHVLRVDLTESSTQADSAKSRAEQ